MTIDVPGIAAELAQVQSAIKDLQEREYSLKATLRELGPGRHDAGALTVSITPNRKVDEAKLTVNFPQDTWPHFYVVKPNLKIVKESIPPATYETFMIEYGEPKIRIS